MSLQIGTFINLCQCDLPVSVGRCGAGIVNDTVEKYNEIHITVNYVCM